MTVYFVSTINPYTSNCFMVELPHCCALKRLHNTDQHVSQVATGKTPVIVVFSKATCPCTIEISFYLRVPELYLA